MSRPQNTGEKPASGRNGRPGFFRIAAAMCYDSLLLLAVLFFATALALPLNAGHAFSSTQTAYPIYLLLVSFAYFGWFWTHGGQTLGMKAWKLKVCRTDSARLDWRTAFVRFSAALISLLCGGLGFLWINLDRQRRSWHDHLSKTHIVFADA